MQVFRRGDTIGYDDDARVVVSAAASCAQRSKGLVVPESLLMVMLEDAEVAAAFGADLVTVRGALAADRERWPHERVSTVAGWSQPARAALNTAAWRAMTSQRRILTRGDLAFGLARSGGVAGPLAARIVPAWYDRASVAPRSVDGRADVFVINDDATPMEFVIDALKSHFGLGELGALYRMMRTHHRGSAHVGAWEARDAEARATAAREAAEKAGFPLRFEISAG